MTQSPVFDLTNRMHVSIYAKYVYQQLRDIRDSRQAGSGIGPIAPVSPEALDVRSEFERMAGRGIDPSLTHVYVGGWEIPAMLEWINRAERMVWANRR